MQNLRYQGGEIMELEEKEQLTQIVQRVQQDENNFELLYNRSIKKVYYWCYTILKDESLAKDLAQESMIKIYYKFHTLKNPEAYTTWMYTLARNLCYNYIRDHQNSHTISLEVEDHLKENLEEDTLDYLPQDSYNLKETKKTIVTLIRLLPEKQQEVITLFYLEELTLAEISDVVNSNVGAVKSRLHLGRKNLEREIQQYEKSHKTKLYASVTLPFLGEIFKGDANDLWKKQEIKYQAKAFNNNGLFSLEGLKGILALKPFVIGLVSLSVLVVLGTLTFFAFNQQNEHGTSNSDSAKGVAAFEKDKGNVYIEGITQSTFSTRTYTEVTIQLKKLAYNREITVEFKGNPVEFERKEDQLYLNLKENGTYTVTVGKSKTDFEVTQIDSSAIEVEKIYNRGTYLELDITDELKQIDYTSSYVLHDGEKYKINHDNTVTGQFNGLIKVYLYNNSGQYVYYTFNLN